MEAVIQGRYGSADVLEFRDIDRPAPAASSSSRCEVPARAGRLYSCFAYSLAVCPWKS